MMLPLSPQSADIVDRLLGEFLLSCIGRNDMSVATAMVSAALTIVRAHCDRTGEDFDELTRLLRDVFEAAAQVLRKENRG